MFGPLGDANLLVARHALHEVAKIGEVERHAVAGEGPRVEIGAFSAGCLVC
jgi:hypothetical protein